MSEELKSCPFCGGTAALAEEGDRTRQYLVFCNSCGISTDADTRRERPVSDWNTRRPEPPRREAEQRVYNELHAYYQDLIMPGGAIGREELLARLAMLADEAGGMFTPAKGKEKKP
jgi:Lar family restriction alleviation protein